MAKLTRLDEIKLEYTKVANIYVPDWESKSKTYLVNKYVEAKDNQNTVEIEGYLAAVVLKYWYKVIYLFTKSKSAHMEIEDFVAWVIEAIELACSYRRWQDPESPLYQNPNGADTVINKCIDTVRLRHYYLFNLDKSKANYVLDDTDILEDQDYQEKLIDRMELFTGMDANKRLVTEFVKNNRLTEAIFIDTILNKDVFSSDKVVNWTGNLDEKGRKEKNSIITTQFSPRKFYATIRSLSLDYCKEFSEKYDISPDKVKEVTEKLATMPNVKLYNYTKRVFEGFKRNNSIKEYLCW